MVDYGLKDRVALITGANNPQGIGATTAFAFARERAKVVLVYKRIPRPFDVTKTDKNGADRYFQESRLPGEISITSDMQNTTLMAESKEELKSLLMQVKEESDKAGLKLNIQKAKIGQ